MKTKNLIVGAAMVVLAGWLGACGTPKNHCTVVVGANINYPYWMKYLSSDKPSDTCGQLKGENIGFSMFNPPRTEDFSIAWRVDGIGLPLASGYTSTETDAANGGQGCLSPYGVCSSLEDPKSNGSAKMPAFPTGDVCEMSTFVGAEQHFDAIPPTLDDDGGVIDPGSPAFSAAYNFTKLRFSATTNAPGTTFDGELDYTDDNCTAHYKVFAFYPAIGCATDADCNPIADPDAGYVVGSGINPTFDSKDKPVTCNTDVGMCELSYTSVDEINQIK